MSSRYEATFEIESRSYAQAVDRLMDRMYDSLREEAREIYQGDAAKSDVLDAFAAIRDATGDPSPGTLTVVYETHHEPFDD